MSEYDRAGAETEDSGMPDKLPGYDAELANLAGVETVAILGLNGLAGTGKSRPQVLGQQPPTAAQLQQMIWQGDVRLDDGDGTRSPVWHALLHPDEAGIVDTVDSQAAISTFHALTLANPYAVLACKDQTADRARQILEEALTAPAMD